MARVSEEKHTLGMFTKQNFLFHANGSRLAVSGCLAGRRFTSIRQVNVTRHSASEAAIVNLSK